MVDPTLARTLLAHVLDVDARLRHPTRLPVVDIGAGDGRLLSDLLALCRLEYPGLAARMRPIGIDVRRRPETADRQITWITGEAPAALHALAPMGLPLEGVVIAHEWLDTIPCDVIEIGREGQPCIVLVDEAGNEFLGASLWDASRCAQEGLDPYPLLDWLDRWWPSAMPTTFLDEGPEPVPGVRAEVGLTRDAALAVVAQSVRRGRIVVVDYCHTLEERNAGRCDLGSLIAYGQGRAVDAIPDGSCDITAHVAIDSCAEAAMDALASLGRRASVTITTQHDALASRGVTQRLPDIAMAKADSLGYARELAGATSAMELLDRNGLGAFTWLVIDVE